jgi:hypothetical protein
MAAMSPIVAFLIHILEWAFVVGMLGSAVVVLITSIEDVEVVFEPETPTPPPHEGNPSTD